MQNSAKRQRTEEQQGGAAAAAATRAAVEPAQRDLVIIWDLDETLLIFNSLISGSWAASQRRQGDTEQLRQLGRRWEAALLALCDDRFFFKELEEYDQTCLEDIRQFDDGASLAGYDWSSDGFPPAGATAHTPEQHAAAAHPAPLVGTGHGGSGAGAEQQQQAQQQPGQQEQERAAVDGAGASPPQPPSGRQLLGSPASQALDAESLRKAAYRYRHIAKLLKFGLGALGTAAQRQEWQELYSETDAATSGWLSHAASLLAACSTQLPSRGGSGSGSGGATSTSAGSGSGGSPLLVTHVAVTSGQLIPSLAKLLLFQLVPHIAAQHVWSSRYEGKLRCFERVRRRFGAGCTYLAIGDGIEEDEAAAQLGWPYIRVLLAPPEHYPAEHVAALRQDAATGAAGLPFPQLTAAHIAAAAGLQQGAGDGTAGAAAAGAAAAAGGPDEGAAGMQGGEAAAEPADESG